MGASDYELLECVGQGTFGVAHKARCLADGQLYCLKRIAIADAHDSGSAQQDGDGAALSEAKLLSSLDHPNIIHYKESFIDPEDGALCIVTTFCAGGDLFSEIRRRAAGAVGAGRAASAPGAAPAGWRAGGGDGCGGSGSGSGRSGGGGSRGPPAYFSEDEVMDLFLQIAGALHYIHGRRVLHRDLKTQNILLDGSGIVMLADFGISKVLQQADSFATTMVGTPVIMAPEVCTSQPYTFKSDIWSLGCVLYEMATLTHAFSADCFLSLVYKIVRGEVPKLPAGRYSEGLGALIGRLLTRDPQHRPSLQEVFAMPYVQRHVQRFNSQQRRRVLERRRSLRPGAGRSGGCGADAGAGAAAAAGGVCEGAGWHGAGWAGGIRASSCRQEPGQECDAAGAGASGAGSFSGGGGGGRPAAACAAPPSPRCPRDAGPAAGGRGGAHGTMSALGRLAVSAAAPLLHSLSPHHAAPAAPGGGGCSGSGSELGSGEGVGPLRRMLEQRRQQQAGACGASGGGGGAGGGAPALPGAQRRDDGGEGGWRPPHLRHPSRTGAAGRLQHPAAAKQAGLQQPQPQSPQQHQPQPHAALVGTLGHLQLKKSTAVALQGPGPLRTALAGIAAAAHSARSPSPQPPPSPLSPLQPLSPLSPPPQPPPAGAAATATPAAAPQSPAAASCGGFRFGLSTEERSTLASSPERGGCGGAPSSSPDAFAAAAARTSPGSPAAAGAAAAGLLAFALDCDDKLLFGLRTDSRPDCVFEIGARGGGDGFGGGGSDGSDGGGAASASCVVTLSPRQPDGLCGGSKPRAPARGGGGEAPADLPAPQLHLPCGEGSVGSFLESIRRSYASSPSLDYGGDGGGWGHGGGGAGAPADACACCGGADAGCGDGWCEAAGGGGAGEWDAEPDAPLLFDEPDAPPASDSDDDGAAPPDLGWPRGWPRAGGGGGGGQPEGGRAAALGDKGDLRRRLRIIASVSDLSRSSVSSGSMGAARPSLPPSALGPGAPPAAAQFGALAW